MKTHKHFSVILILLLLTLSGCATAPSAELTALEKERNEALALAEGYLLHITELENTLQGEREERYISESRYEQRIRELEEALEQQASSGGVTNEDTAEMVFHYQVRDGVAVITGYEGNYPFVSVPASLDGYPVRVIGERAFENKSPVTVILPEGLSQIEWFAFYGCATLTDIAIPASVQSIGHAVFDGCPTVTLVCVKGSFAEEYAKSYGLPCLTQ